jgi:hypothetical protein
MMRNSVPDPVIVKAIRRIRGMDSSLSLSSSSPFEYNVLPVLIHSPYFADTSLPLASGRFKLVAVTNNYARSLVGLPQSELDFLGWSDGSTAKEVKELFDDFVDSSVVGLRYVETP